VVEIFITIARCSNSRIQDFQEVQADSVQVSKPAGFALAVMIEAKKEIPLSFLLATSIVLMNLTSPFPMHPFLR
jgi:hypothetical protein